MSPCPPSGLTLEDLVKQRDRLLALMTSGIVEVEQPALGRTQYRTLAEIADALRFVNEQIMALCGPGVLDERKKRAPIYPVVTEW